MEPQESNAKGSEPKILKLGGTNTHTNNANEIPVTSNSEEPLVAPCISSYQHRMSEDADCSSNDVSTDSDLNLQSKKSSKCSPAELDITLQSGGAQSQSGPTEEVKDGANQLQNLRIQNASLRKQLERHEDVITWLKREKDEMCQFANDSNSILETEIKEGMDHINSLRKRLLEVDLVGTKLDETKFVDVVYDLKSAVAELEVVVSKLIARNVKLLEDASDLEGVIEKNRMLAARNGELSSELARLEADSANVRGELRKVQLRSEELVNEVEDLRGHHGGSVDTMNDLKVKIAEISSDSMDLKARCLELTACILKTVSGVISPEKRKQFQNRIAKLESENLVLMSATKELEKPVVSLLSQSNAPKSQLSNDAKHSLQNVESKSVENVDCERQRIFVANHAHNILNHVDNLESVNAELRKELHCSRLKECTLEARNGELQNIIDDLNKEIWKLKADKQKLLTENTHEWAFVDSSTEAALLSQLNCIQRKFQDQREQCEKLDAEHFKDLAEIKQLKCLVTELSDQLRQHQKIIAGEVESQKTKYLRFRSIREQLEANAEASEIRAAELDDQVHFLKADMNHEMSDFQNYLQLMQQKVDDLQAQLSRGCGHELEMSIVHQEFERREAALEQEVRRLRDENKCLQMAADNRHGCSACTKLMATNTDLTKEICALEKRMLDLKAERDRLFDEFTIANDGRETFKAHCDEYHEECDTLNAELLAVRKELNEALQKIEASDPAKYEKLQADFVQLQAEFKGRIKATLLESGRNEAEKRKQQINIGNLEGLVKVLEKKNAALLNELRRIQLQKANTTFLTDVNTSSEDHPRENVAPLQGGYDSGQVASSSNIASSVSKDHADSSDICTESAVEQRNFKWSSKWKTPPIHGSPQKNNLIHVSGSSSKVIESVTPESKENCPTSGVSCLSPLRKKKRSFDVILEGSPPKQSSVLKSISSRRNVPRLNAAIAAHEYDDADQGGAKDDCKVN